MEIRILGPLEVVEDGRAIAIASPLQRALLALLLLHAGRPVSTESILDALWGDSPPESGAGSVAFHVSRLRAALEPGQAVGSGGANGRGPIATEAGGYSLRIEPDALDAARFERLASEGHERIASEPAMAAERLRDALALWRGEPLAGLGDLAFLQPEIARLRELRLRAFEDRFEVDLALGHGRDIAGEVEALVVEEPLREHLRAQLMRAFYGAGRQADALRVYQEGRRLLAEELGIDPSPELQALELAILRQDAKLDVTRPLSGPRNPYKGLRPFGEADAIDFFGREMFAARLLERLDAVSRAGRLLLLVGPSGSGKSSVIRAGLLPLLRARSAPRREGWRVAIMLPGSRPEEALLRSLDAVVPDADGLGAGMGADPADVDVGVALARAAAADPRPLLLVIDQLEELFALATDPAMPARFLRGIAAALTGPPPRPAVVTSLRADWFDRPLLSAELGALIQDGIEVVTPLTRDELERAIVRPAAAVGVELEPGLAADLEADVVDRPGALPLLQFALTELFERGNDKRLSRESYAAIGGVAGAVGRRAEAVFAALDQASRGVARQLFLRLAAVGEGRNVAARRVVVDDLRSIEPIPERVDAVLEAFGRWRLLAFDRDPRTGRATVEPAHEALLTHWPRLAGWIQEAEEALWMEGRLEATATEWAAAHRDPGFLLSGSRLDLFEAWSTTTDIRLDALERELLEASLAERRRAESAERDRRDQERRLERRAATRLRALVAVLLVAVVGASGLLAVVWRQAEGAREDRAIATARELAVAANGRLDADPTLALLLAVEAARATADRGWIAEEALDALHWAIQGARIPYPTEDAPVAVRVALDGARGVYLLPVADLVDLAEAGAGRILTTAECRAYLHQPACPVSDRGWSDGDQAVMTADGPVMMEALAPGGAPGASLRVFAQLPADLAGALADYAAEGQAIAITSDDGTADPRSTVELADVAILARPGDVADLARAGSLLALDDILSPTEVATLEARPLADLGWAGPRGVGSNGEGSRFVGAPVAASASSLLWYPAEAFAQAGYEPPATWAELELLVERMIGDGRTPWCLGLLGGERDGTNGADLIEDLVLDRVTAQWYDKWASGLFSFDHPLIAATYERYHALVHLDGAVLGGPGVAVRTPAAWAALQMGTAELPECWLLHASGDQRARWEGVVREDLTPIRFPTQGDGTNDLRGRAYTLVILRDRPEVRALVRHLLGAEFASRLVTHDTGSGLVPIASQGAPVDRPAFERISASLVASAIMAGDFRPDASDRMPWNLGVIAFPESALRVAEAPAGSPTLSVARELEVVEETRSAAAR
jgi:DNA-binding SARP family transcriptional activator